MEDIKIYSYFFDVIIITDARLVEEVEVPKKLFDCVTIRLSRNDNKLTDSQKNHITETNLDDYKKFDYIINNDDGDINNLKLQILKILKEEI